MHCLLRIVPSAVHIMSACCWRNRMTSLFTWLRCSQELRLIPDESTDSRQGGQWTAGARMWPGLVVFAVPSPLCHLADQRQVHLADQQQGHSQHMSLVILSNAPALGQSVKAATKHSQQTPEGLAMLIHLDPHSSQPYPNCKNRQWRCPQCQSCVFRGQLWVG